MFLFVVKAPSDVGSEAPKEEGEKIDQPYELKFVKGRDGGTYIDDIAPGGSADKAGMFNVSDQVFTTRFEDGVECFVRVETGFVSLRLNGEVCFIRIEITLFRQRLFLDENENMQLKKQAS
ncbi:hypothetical protein KIW84_071659 [Lathyrus oleraceus]|uniref:Uncharacterized protein n=1 Tax=Pisum sativum TaxID=3888 RepID=A0A9D4VK27_PEA|nr:hypothetical protein KIW84_071659 [Pisum sativum]